MKLIVCAALLVLLAFSHTVHSAVVANDEFDSREPFPPPDGPFPGPDAYTANGGDGPFPGPDAYTADGDRPFPGSDAYTANGGDGPFPGPDAYTADGDRPFPGSDAYTANGGDTGDEGGQPPSDLFMREMRETGQSGGRGEHVVLEGFIGETSLPPDEGVMKVPPIYGEGELQELDVKDQQVSSYIYHGNYIALQPSYYKRHWLGCAGNPCGRATCPRLYMEGTDWTNCWGEVFRIFRMSGPGYVRVGDVIGIYYPRESGRWFGCAGSLCGKATCPGLPSWAYGFQDRDRWFRCWGEVFKIYARNKGLGAVITRGDHITLFYLQRATFIGLVGTYPDHRTCPGPTRPPPAYKYDICWGENFEISKR